MPDYDDELLNELLNGGQKKPMEDLPLYGVSPVQAASEAIKKDQEARAFLHPENPAAPPLPKE